MYRGKHARSGLSLPWMQNMESEDCTWLSPGRTPRHKPHGSYRWMPWLVKGAGIPSG